MLPVMSKPWREDYFRIYCIGKKEQKAIHLVAQDKRGISASQLSRELETAYSSAWYLLQRLRKAIGERDKNYVLSGIIELDNVYFGAPNSNGKCGRGADWELTTA